MALSKRPAQAVAEKLAGHNQIVPDVIAPDLRVLFVGINPGLYSAKIHHHFGHPGNRFWRALHAGGFTPRVLTPYDEAELPQWGCGLTNIVDRPTATAAEVLTDELRAGAQILARKIARYRPAIVAVLGVTSYRVAFDRPHAQVGRDAELLAGAVLWVLPNPSGLNAHYTPKALARVFAELHMAATALPRSVPHERAPAPPTGAQ